MTDGVFIDRRSHWLGRIGEAGVCFSKYAGGALQVAGDPEGTFPSRSRQGGELAAAAMRLAVRVRPVCQCEPDAADAGQPVLIRQENDPAPKFHFLEEGCVRLGMRVAFDLLDDEGHYHGDGRQDVWIYPEGDIHITWAIQTVDQLAHGAIQDAYVEVQGDNSYEGLRVGSRELAAGEEARAPFGDELPEKALVLHGSVGAAALYWVRDQGNVWEVGSDHGPMPPFYASRWPTGMQQWSRGRMGWALDASAGVNARLDSEGPQVEMGWLRGASQEEDLACAASLVVSLASDEAELERRVAATQQPLIPEVVGGDFRCYTEEDGTYEIGQADPNRMRVTFPADPLERMVRVRHYRRKTDPRHRGGVVATANGQPLRAQLMSEGELTDDICVVMEMSHRNDSVDDVLVATQLDRRRPTEIAIDRVPGIQATYQSEITGVDLRRRAGNRRDVVVWSSRNQRAPALELDLFSGAVHHVAAQHRVDPVIWEMPMAWFLSCGVSKHHYCNYLEDFSIDINGPDRVEMYFRGVNANGGAQSETWLAIPFDHPRTRMEVKMRMEVLQQWDHANVEFSDIFPYPSRLPETWCHDAVLFLQRDRGAIMYTQRPDRSARWGGASEADPGDRLFYGLYAADRGNVLTLMRNRSHSEHPFHYSVCGNYIDIHVNLDPGPPPTPAGKVFEVEYVCEIYGDATTSADEIREIGERSLRTGELAID
ncbi:hypothetical protein ACFL6X_04510 [Candidatus Latescibacterota bacterium]